MPVETLTQTVLWLPDSCSNILKSHRLHGDVTRKDGGERSFARRPFIRHAVALGATGAIAGCTGDIPGIGGGNSAGAPEPIRKFVRGHQEDDPQLVRSSIHPNGPLSGGVTDEEIDRLHVEIISGATVPDHENVHRVRLEIDAPDMGTRTQVFTFWLRSHEGTAKIWNLEQGSPSENLSTPTETEEPTETETGEPTETETEEQPEETPTDALFYDGFENGVERWHVHEDAWGQTETAYRGNYGAGIDAGGQLSALASVELEQPRAISTFRYYWLETSGSYGGGVRLFNGADEMEIGVATDNPEWVVDDAEGPQSVDSGTDYGRWIRTELTFDWDNSVVMVSVRDTESGTNYTGSHGLKQGYDIQRIELTAFTSRYGWENGSCEMYWDDLVAEM